MAKSREELIQEERQKMTNEERTVLALEQIADQLTQIKGDIKGFTAISAARGKSSTFT